MRHGSGGRLAHGALSLLLTLALPCMSAADAPLFWLETRGGSWLLCEIDAPTQPLFRTEKGPRAIALSDIALLTFAPHDDPNLVNEAIVACGDLSSDDFERRAHAIERLKRLGPVARSALESVSKSDDHEAARQAKNLLKKLGDSAPRDDHLTLRSGETLAGVFVADELKIATLWRSFIFPLNAVRSLEMCTKPPTNVKLQRAVSSAEARTETEFAASRGIFQPSPDSAMGGGEIKNSLVLNSDKIPVRNKDGTIFWKATLANERLDDAYAPLNIWMRPKSSNARIESAMRGPLPQFSCDSTEIDILFSAPPGSTDPPHALAFQARGKGVHAFQVARVESSGGMSLSAYDKQDRLVGTVLSNQGVADFYSEVPISRVHLTYTLARSTTFEFGPIVLGPRLSALAHPNEVCVYLTSGEILTGEFFIIDPKHFGLRAEFMEKGSAPLTFAMDELARFEAPWKHAEPFVGPPPPQRMQDFFWPQDIVLQTGDRLKAELVLLDDKQAILGLGQNVTLTLPRALLRRVGFRRFRNDEENLNQTAEAAAAEKPGVKLFTKADLTNTAVPQINEEADPKHNPAAGLQTVDNAEIAAFNAQQREITLHDNDGDFPFDASSVKALVFPVLPAAGAHKGTWRLTLRNGLPLVAELLELNAENVVLEIAGGKVQMPLERIDSIERIDAPK